MIGNKLLSFTWNINSLIKVLISNLRIANPDFQLFKNYKRFMKRRPDAKFYLLDPRSIWNLWKQLHIYTGVKIRQNPPSSGFIGNYCDLNILCYSNSFCKIFLLIFLCFRVSLIVTILCIRWYRWVYAIN